MEAPYVNINIGEQQILGVRSVATARRALMSPHSTLCGNDANDLPRTCTTADIYDH